MRPSIPRAQRKAEKAVQRFRELIAKRDQMAAEGRALKRIGQQVLRAHFAVRHAQVKVVAAQFAALPWR